MNTHSKAILLTSAACFLVFPICCLPQSPASGMAPLRVGPVTTDGEILSALDLDAPGMEKVRAAKQSGNIAAAQQAYLDYRRHVSQAKWIITPSDEPAKAVASDDSAADLILGHRLTPESNADSLPKIVDMGKEFNWTYNPLSPRDPGYTQEWTYCSVSRTNFWEKLADAYWKTHDEKYAAGWVDQLLDFAAKNPVPPGKKDMFHSPLGATPILWRSLDIAVRMRDSWPYAYSHFLNSPSFTPEAQWTFLKLVYEHGVRLRAGLEDQDRTGNWVTAESSGLYTVGVLFPELREAANWRQFAIDRFAKEFDRMVPPDGFEAELSPGYDRSTIGEFRTPIELADINHLQVPDNFRSKLLSMHRALVLVMAQNGDDVPTNDSFGVSHAVSEARRGLKLGDDPLLLWAASSGKEGTAPPDSTMLPYAGFYAMRGGWKPDDFFLFFRGGPTGIGHQHEDMLEVVLRAWNRTLLFDPGTYTYDQSEERRYVVGTSSHNTIIVDGNGQHRGLSKPFPPELKNPWVTTPLFDYVSAMYDAGYQQNVYSQEEFYPLKWVGSIDKSVSHTRRVLFLRPYYALVLDTLDGTGHHVFDAHFHIDAPAAEVDPLSQAAFSKSTDNVHLALYPLEREHLAVDVVQGQKSPMLGWYPRQHRTIPTVRFRKEQEAPAIFATFLYPYQGDADANFKAEPLPIQGDGFWGETLDTAKEQAEVILAKDGQTKAFSLHSELVGTVHADAAGVIARRPIGERVVFIGGWGLHSYGDDKLGFSLKRQGDLVFLDTKANSPVFFNGQDRSVEVTITYPFKGSANLAPGVWTEVTREGIHLVPAPSLFSPLAP